MMNKQDLFTVIEEAKNNGDGFAVLIETRGTLGNEIIINPYSNCDTKKEYYDKSYDDNLVLKSYDGIKIISATVINKNVLKNDILPLLKQF